MRDIKFSALIRKSMDRTEALLFKPFHLKKWFVFLFIAALSGSLGGGNSFNASDFNRIRDRGENPFAQQEEPLAAGENAGDVIPPSIDAAASGTSDVTLTPAETIQRSETDISTLTNEIDPTEEALTTTEDDEPPADAAGERQSAPLSLLIPVGLLLITLGLLFSWLGTRFQFIWFHTLTTAEPAVRAPFRHYRTCGNSLFKTTLLLLLALFAVVALSLLLLAIPIMGIVLGGIALIGFGIGFAVFSFFLIDFIVPIMAIDQSRFKDAWRNFVEIYRENTGDLWRYVFVRIGIGLLTLIMQGMILVGAALLLVVAAAIIFGIPYALLVLLLKANAIFTVLAVILAIPFGLAAILLIASAGLPFAVFFRTFSLLYLSSLKTKYTPLPLE